MELKIKFDYLVYQPCIEGYHACMDLFLKFNEHHYYQKMGRKLKSLDA